jgi:hypothetical protein
MGEESEGGGATRLALIQLAEALLQHYNVTRPPVPVEQMLKDPPNGLGGIDSSRISFIMEHGLYCYEPRLSMARLLCREIARSRAVQGSFGIEVSSYSYDDLKFFARCLMMPAGWVQTMAWQKLSVEEISDELQAPLYSVVTRLAELGLPVPGV